jgi:hypothetical protein
MYTEQKVHVIIQSKHFCLLKFPVRILKLKTYLTTILLIVLFVCETWSLTLRKECKLRLLEKIILKGIFRSKVNENE